MTLRPTIYIMDACFESECSLENFLRQHFDIHRFEDLDGMRDLLQSGDRRLPDLVVICEPERELNFLDSYCHAFGCYNFPFIVVSGVDELGLIQSSFELGADDVLVQPISANLLVYKINRILAERFDSYADIEIDATNMAVRSRGESSVKLTPKELRIMWLLKKDHENVVSRDDIIQDVWGQTRVSHKTFDVHLFNLRRKLSSLNIEIVHTQPKFYSLRCKN